MKLQMTQPFSVSSHVIVPSSLLSHHLTLPLFLKVDDVKCGKELVKVVEFRLRKKLEIYIESGSFTLLRETSEHFGIMEHYFSSGRRILLSPLHHLERSLGLGLL